MSAEEAQCPIGVLERASTFLFVPGSRPDRFEKAAVSGADVVIVDLEDAVEPGAKDEARRSVLDWLESGRSAVVRVNSSHTPWFEADVAAVADRAMAIVLPKVDGSKQLDALRALAPEVPVIPLIETSAGVLNAFAICSSPRVVRTGFGNVDFAADTGVDPASHRALVTARSHLVYAASAAGRVSPIDGVTTVVDDDETIIKDTLHARELGFTAKLLIHPRQVERVAQTLKPTPQEIAWASRVLDAVKGGVGLHEGHMIDEPVLARARRLLERAEPMRADL